MNFSASFESETEQVNERVRQVLIPYKNATVGKKSIATRGSYTDYASNQRQSKYREAHHEEWSC